jgi:hypothetical protein
MHLQTTHGGRCLCVKRTHPSPSVIGLRNFFWGAQTAVYPKTDMVLGRRPTLNIAPSLLDLHQRRCLSLLCLSRLPPFSVLLPARCVAASLLVPLCLHAARLEGSLLLGEVGICTFAVGYRMYRFDLLGCLS